MTTVKRPSCTLEQSAGRVTKGARDAHAILKDALARTEDHATLNAFVALPDDEAATHADAANALRENNAHTPLTGAPIAISDNLVTAWGETNAGSRMLRGYQSPFNATVVDALLEAGAVPFGKTNVSEMGVGISSQSSRHGITRNPVSLSYRVGGAAAGAAAAVAACIVPAALAVDTVGGARLAAARTGVLSFRPSYGSLSRYGVIAYASSFDAVTLMGHSVSDLAQIYQQIAAYDPKDGTSLPAPRADVVSALDAPKRPLRVGIIKELWALPMDDAVRTALESTRALLESKGCELVECSISSAKNMAAAASLLSAAEASTNFARYDGVRFGHRTESPQDIETLYARSRAEGFGPDVIHTILLGTYMLYRDNYAAQYQRAQRVRHRVALDYKKVFEDVDLLLGPVQPNVSPAVDDPAPTPEASAHAQRFCAGEALAGLPAVTLPAGEGPHGLPISVQLTANAHDETTLFSSAQRLHTWLTSTNEESP